MRLTLLLLALPLLLFGIAPAAGQDAAQTKTDQEAFKAYLEKTHAGKKWQIGPIRLDSEEVRKAYPKQRFYFIFSSPPLPPGAPLPDLLKNYEKRMEEYRRDFMSLTVRIDENGKIGTLLKPDDYNQGLMKVANDDDAKTAAAAVLALHGSGRVGPGPVTAGEVTVEKNEKGWSCSVNRKLAFQGGVGFDATGKCVRVSKVFTGPLPP